MVYVEFMNNKFNIKHFHLNRLFYATYVHIIDAYSFLQKSTLPNFTIVTVDCNGLILYSVFYFY